ncbi:MAG: hypothetical protein AAF950_18340 [Pseudomonadota bacterium]
MTRNAASAGSLRQEVDVERELLGAITTTETQSITLKLRLRDKYASELNRMARAVNVVWNYCDETQQRAVQDRRRWLGSVANLSRAWLRPIAWT